MSHSPSPNKGLAAVLELAHILKGNPEVQFYLVGNQLSDPLCGGDVQYFDNVEYLGWINDRSELAKVFRSVDLFVYPSKNDCSPNVLLEAMACGVPVVTIDSGGNKELVIKPDCRGGVIMDPLNPVLAIRTVKENLQSFSQGALSLIEKYHTQKQMVNNYAALIDSFFD